MPENEETQLLAETEVSIQELKYAFAVVKEAKSFGILLESSADLLKAAKRVLEDPNFVKVAVRLAELENKTGKKYEELENTLKKLHSEIKELNSGIQEKEKRLSFLEQSISKLEKRRSELLKEIDRLEKRRKEERAKFEEENSSYRAQLRAMKARLDRELRKQHIIRDEIEEFIEIKREFRNSPSIKEEVKRLFEESNSLVQAKKKLQREVEELEKKRDTLCQDIDMLIAMKIRAEKS